MSVKYNFSAVIDTLTLYIALKISMFNEEVISLKIFLFQGRAVQTAKSLDEGLNMVIPLPNTRVVSMENNGKLVHLIGELQTDKVLLFSIQS